MNATYWDHRVIQTILGVQGIGTEFAVLQLPGNGELYLIRWSISAGTMNLAVQFEFSVEGICTPTANIVAQTVWVNLARTPITYEAILGPCINLSARALITIRQRGMAVGDEITGNVSARALGNIRQASATDWRLQ